MRCLYIYTGELQYSIWLTPQADPTDCNILIKKRKKFAERAVSIYLHWCVQPSQDATTTINKYILELSEGGRALSLSRSRSRFAAPFFFSRSCYSQENKKQATITHSENHCRFYFSFSFARRFKKSIRFSFIDSLTYEKGHPLPC